MNTDNRTLLKLHTCLLAFTLILCVATVTFFLIDYSSMMDQISGSQLAWFERTREFLLLCYGLAWVSFCTMIILRRMNQQSSSKDTWTELGVLVASSAISLIAYGVIGILTQVEVVSGK